MNWIKRDLESLLLSPDQGLSLFPIWLLLGPRQVGKTSLLKKCAESSRAFITLDDLNIRLSANEDPQFFLSQFKPPLAIDEIQYAPGLLSELKRWVDTQNLSAGAIWLTGSQNFSVMKHIQESLAGRVGILNLFGLSDVEKNRRSPPGSYFDSLLETSFPKLCGVTESEARSFYLHSYLQTYIEKDVAELGGITKRREFENFIKICALRTGQVIEYSSLAKDAGISPITAKEWLSLLEDSFLIKLITPYFSNLNKRLIKSPKLHFLDAGLAAYLCGWRDSTQVQFGPMSGALFETHIFGQIWRSFKSRNQELQLHYWRTRDGQEIDFLVETGGRVFPVEVKLGRVNPRDLVSLDKIKDPKFQQGQCVTLTPGPIPLQGGWKPVLPQDLKFDDK